MLCNTIGHTCKRSVHFGSTVDSLGHRSQAESKPAVAITHHNQHAQVHGCAPFVLPDLNFPTIR
jgi:hypothetical protein